MGDGYDKGKTIGGGIEVEQSVIDGGSSDVWVF
jgi:hypothetical protein